MSLPTVALPSGRQVPALGMGTWKMGEDARRRAAEVAALRRGIELGMTLIDTAEMYGEGAAERLIGETVRGRRDEVFLVSKVYPHNASRHGVAAACERSLKRLGVDSIDLYLLHWRGSIPLAETLEAFEELRRAGKIAAFGVSNFDTVDLEESWAAAHGREIAVNQILYNLTRRGVEIDLLPWCREQNVAVMAYSPIEQGRLARDANLKKMAAARGVTAAQLALQWVLAQPGVIVIPKAGDPAHVEENRAAAELSLTDREMAELNSIFPRPSKRKPLEML